MSENVFFKVARGLIAYGICGFLPMAFLWGMNSSIDLSPHHFLRNTFFTAVACYGAVLILALRGRSLQEASKLLGLGGTRASPYRGWKLAVLSTFAYGVLAVLIGFGYMATAAVLVEHIPPPSETEIPAVLLSLTHGSGGRIHPCLTHMIFHTRYGNESVCLTDIKQFLPMPSGLAVGDAVLLKGRANEYVLELDAIARAPHAGTR